jgi:hypothetical protein
MTIDEFLPDFDVVERHQTIILAPVSQTYIALHSTDFGRPMAVKALLALRALPSLLLKSFRRQPSSKQPAPKLTLDKFLNSGFVLLSEVKEKEIVLGLVGRFWTLTGCLEETDADRFKREQKAGVAKAAWNFTFEKTSKGTRVRTETRVKCTDESSRRRFRAYWMLVGPFSGLIRRKMLRELRRTAERASAV